MTTLIRGRSTPLRVEWFEYPGGPPAVVNNVIITITPLDGGIAVVGPTSTGVTNPATGINIYQWLVPTSLPVGDYLVVWDGEDTVMNPVQAAETITILSGVSSRTNGPCSTWTPVWCCDLLDMSAVTGTALQAATEVLYALSGYQFDSCPIELWPCRQSCYGSEWPLTGWSEWSGGGGPQPALISGQWFNLSCGQCVDSCSCTVLSQVRLPRPVVEVIEVRVNDVVLVPDVDYRLDNGYILTRLGGETWPTCNDLSQTAGEGTWSVTIIYGQPVPMLGQNAVGELACEFAKACVGADCRLPKPVQSLTRQGVSMTFLDPNELFADGRVGLYFSDLFISTYNPGKRRGRSRVYNIDEPNPWRLG